MNNPFHNRISSLTGPARDVVPVVPNDGTDLATVAVALYVETGGTLSLVTVAGNTRSLIVPDFTILPVGVMRVRATGTTAAGIHALVLG
ncbi:spike base protein, RCAP_Rcc01079 family [Antarctobacter heliothermus]|uniref:Uncharacterized protein n=1 Tax=Antarctobacter heliothermus TaxID=74033 RepID=A0A239DAQ0_9RHOB|nr:hypothetical protein [Antarctobacter heliothermus]SNS29182.1 hypothetical protein SAMN04488078_101022 [Antarctobacter heliothermus]